MAQTHAEPGALDSCGGFVDLTQSTFQQSRKHIALGSQGTAECLTASTLKCLQGFVVLGDVDCNIDVGFRRTRDPVLLSDIA